MHHFSMHFSLNLFIAKDLLAVHFIFILDWGNDVKKQIQEIFLFGFQTGHKAMETTHNFNNTFGSELLMNI